MWVFPKLTRLPCESPECTDSFSFPHQAAALSLSPQKRCKFPRGWQSDTAKRSRSWKTKGAEACPLKSWQASAREDESLYADSKHFFNLGLILLVFVLCDAASASCCWAQGNSLLLRTPPPPPWVVQMVGPDLLESSRWWGQYKCMTESNSRRLFLQSSAEPIHRVIGKALNDGRRKVFEGQNSCKAPYCSCAVAVVAASHLPLGSYL